MSPAAGSFMAGSIVAKLVLDKTGWSSAVKEIGTDTERLMRKASDVSRGMTEVGRAMAGAGAAILGFLGASVAAFAKFDDAFVQSTAIMGDLSADMEKNLKRVARSVGRETTFAASEAAAAYFYLASAGLSVEESMAALPAVAKFAQAGMFGLERATTLLADAQAALGMRIQDDAVKNMENMVRVSDVLSKANILANANIEQFSEAITNRAGAALRMVGKDIEEGAAVLAVFANTGIKGAEAGTRLDIAMRDLQTRSIRNKEAFEKYNVTVFDTNGEMRNMADIVEDLERAMAGQTDEKRRSILMEMDFQDRSVASMLALIGFSSEIRRMEKELRNANGTTDEIANKQLKSLKSQATLTKNSVMGLASAVGESLAPAFLALNEAARDVIRFFTDLTRAVPGVTAFLSINAAIFGVLFTTVGVGLLVMASFIRSVATITTQMPGFGRAISAAGKMAMKGWLALQAFLAGFEIGKWLGKVTKANEYWTNEFGRFFERWGLFQSKVKEIEPTQERLARRQLYLGTASEIAGRQITDLGKAVDIVKKEFIEAGTTGNAALDELLRGFDLTTPPAKKFADEIARVHDGIISLFNLVPGAGDKLDALGKKVVDGIKDLPGFAKWWDDLGAKMRNLDPAAQAAAKALDEMFAKYELTKRSELEAALHDAEIALKDLMASTEKSPGSIKLMKEAIKELREALYGAPTDIDALEKSIGRLTKRSEDLHEWWSGIQEAAAEVGQMKVVEFEDAEELFKGAQGAQEFSNELRQLFAIASTAGEEFGNKLKELKETLRTTLSVDAELAVFEKAMADLGDSLTTEAWAELREAIRKVKQELADSTELGRFAVKMQEVMAKVQQYTQAAFSAINNIISQSQRNREIEIDNEYKKRVAAINATVTNEEEKQKALEALEAEYQIKKTAAQRAGAKQAKAIAMMEAVVNTASAVAEALPNIPLSILVGILGAVQIATIAKQPLPLAEGATFENPTLLQNVLVGEKRPEYLLDKPKLVDIVREAFVTPQLMGVPSMAGAGAGAFSPPVNIHISGPLIHTTGLSRADLEARGEDLLYVINRQLRRIARRP